MADAIKPAEARLDAEQKVPPPDEFEQAFAEHAKEPPADEAAKAAPQDQDALKDDDPPKDKPADAAPADPRIKSGEEAKPADIWAAALPEQKAAWGALSKKATDLEHADRSNRGRLSTLTRRLNDLEARERDAAPAAAAPDKKAPKDDKPTDAKKTYLASDGWKKFKDEYPEVAAPLEGMVSEMRADSERMSRELSTLSTDRRDRAAGEQEHVLDTRHADWRDVTGAKAFGEWLQGQPAYVQDATRKNGESIKDGEEAADIVGRFKASSHFKPAATKAAGSDEPSNLAQRRERQLKSASSVPSRGPGPASGPPEDFDAAFDHYAKRRAQ